MHVLDWIARTDFARSLSDTVAVTGMTVPEDAERMPRGGTDRIEARLGKECGGLVPPDLNGRLRDWWLARPEGANVPNWDLACAARVPDGRPGLILVEAKAHVAEFAGEAKGKPPGNAANHARIAAAVEQAGAALAADVPGLRLSVDRHYQLANRLAFAWKLAASGVPTVLVYLGFTGDDGVGLPIRDLDHWQEVLATAAASVPTATWDRRFDREAAPLHVLARVRKCARPTPPLAEWARASVSSPDPVSRVAASQGPAPSAKGPTRYGTGIP